MRVLENGEKTEKLLSGFFLLEEEEQERFFDVLNALLFAKLRLEVSIDPAIQSKKETSA